MQTYLERVARVGRAVVVGPVVALALATVSIVFPVLLRGQISVVMLSFLGPINYT